MILLTSEKCIPCRLLKEELKKYGIDIKEVDVETPEGRIIARKTGIIGVPAIIDKGKVVLFGYNRKKVKEFVEKMSNLRSYNER